MAYDALLDRIGDSGSSTYQRYPPLVCDDFPQIRFWTKKEWAEHTTSKEDITTTTENPHGRVRASKGINVTMGYVEGENGEVVDGHVTSEIRKSACSIWVHISKIAETGPPAKWGEAGVKYIELYRKQIYDHFLILRYCELDWKVDQIATDNYPSWYSAWHSKSGPSAIVKHERNSLGPDLNMSKCLPDSVTPEPEFRRKKAQNMEIVEKDIEKQVVDVNSSFTPKPHMGSNFEVWTATTIAMPLRC